MSVAINVGEIEVPFRVLAELIVSACDESDFLEALAEESLAIAKQSEDGPEKAFAVEAAKRLRKLATWFEEHQP